ncbi:hypothetical protein [Streptomyces sp. NBC_00690]|uniref:hypothetical protein n=1 Tax=Streptomyces sp. NBC_00690 TaxID=2975808 RepID=UPI002E2BB435|nr:hypothetical protein [Streptomyces sp. NBC_00690]
MRLPAMFWMHQPTGRCDFVPTMATDDDALFSWIDRVTALPVYTDQSLDPLTPYFYQLGTELGYPQYTTPHLTGLLRHPGVQDVRSYVPREISLRPLLQRFEAVLPPRRDQELQPRTMPLLRPPSETMDRLRRQHRHRTQIPDLPDDLRPVDLPSGRPATRPVVPHHQPRTGLIQAPVRRHQPVQDARIGTDLGDSLRIHRTRPPARTAPRSG